MGSQATSSWAAPTTYAAHCKQQLCTIATAATRNTHAWLHELDHVVGLLVGHEAMKQEGTGVPRQRLDPAGMRQGARGLSMNASCRLIGLHAIKPLTHHLFVGWPVALPTCTARRMVTATFCELHKHSAHACSPCHAAYKTLHPILSASQTLCHPGHLHQSPSYALELPCTLS
jgi:hypothetical protein